MERVLNAWGRIISPNILKYGYLTSVIKIIKSASCMVPRNLHLFGPINKNIHGKRLATEADVQEAVTSWLQAFDSDVFYTGI